MTRFSELLSFLLVFLRFAFTRPLYNRLAQLTAAHSHSLKIVYITL